MDPYADLVPVADHYATLPVSEAFTWDRIEEGLPPGEWYMVAFRSILKADADHAYLTRYDDWAHEEASGAVGFVHYFKGPLAADRSCLSFCLWNSRAEARAAAARPAHRDAAALITEMYEGYLLEFLTVRKREATARLEFEAYEAGAHAGPAERPRPAQLGFSPTPS